MTWRLILGACLLIAVSFLGLGIWYLASSKSQPTTEVRSELELWAVLALFFGFQFCLAAVGMARWKRHEVSKSTAWIIGLVTALTVALVSVAYLVADY
jgi:hypothetical protein